MLNDSVTRQEVLQLHNAIRLRWDDEQVRFLEWESGQEILNPDVSGLISEPARYVEDANMFADVLTAAVAKFQYLISKQERELKHLHEKIALLAGEAEAEAITTLDRPAPSSSDKSSLADRVKRADDLGNFALKWGGKAIQFGTWTAQILQHLKH